MKIQIISKTPYHNPFVTVACILCKPIIVNNLELGIATIVGGTDEDIRKLAERKIFVEEIPDIPRPIVVLAEE
jgi:hypothetical protein